MENTNDIDNSIISEFKNKGKIHAVKLCCDLYNIGMSEGKAYVEELTKGIKPNSIGKPDNKNNSTNKKSTNIGCFVLFILVVIVIVVSMCGDDESKQKDKSSGVDSTTIRIESFALAQSIIMNQLVAPSTAEFPHSDQFCLISGDSMVVVRGVVDAQNSFGAMIRNKYYLAIKYNQGYKNFEDYTITYSNLVE